MPEGYTLDELYAPAQDEGYSHDDLINAEPHEGYSHKELIDPPEPPKFESPIELPPTQPGEVGMYEKPTWVDESVVNLGDSLFPKNVALNPRLGRTAAPGTLAATVESGMSPAMQGVSETLRNAVNSLTTPRNLAYMAGSMGMASTGAAGKLLVSGLWSALMGKNAIEDAPRIGAELGSEMANPENKRDTKKIASLLTQAGIDTFMAAAPAVHLSSEMGLGDHPTDLNTFRAEAAQELPKQETPNQEPTPTVEGTPPQTAPILAASPIVPEPVFPTEERTDPLAGPGSPSISEMDPDPGNPDIYGIAQRVRDERAKAGQVAEVFPGEGTTPQDSIQRGRELLSQDPTTAIRAVEAFESDPSKGISADGVAAARAHGEDLASKARNIEQTFGTNSDEYAAAWKELSNWDKRTKPMQTEWHKIGQAQQGETDIDTGSFTGLNREFFDKTGKDIPQSKSTKAKAIAKEVTDADVAAESARTRLFNKIKEDTTTAEQKALDAANKTVRENAIRVAEAESKYRAAKSIEDQYAAKIQEEAAKKAMDESVKRAKDAAVKAAKSETADRVKEASKPNIDSIQAKAAKKALDAASKAVRDNAVRLADAETKQRVAKTVAEKKLAQVEVERAKKRIEQANKEKIKAAIEAAKAESKERVARADLPSYVWSKAREYLDKGIDDFDTIRNKIATDLGLPVSKVTAAMGKVNGAKFLTDDLWKKQQTLRRLDGTAKRWLKEQQASFLGRNLSKIPRFMFGLKVAGHGFVALGTHAPMVAFQPRYWKTYIENYAKMVHMVGSKTFYETQAQDLIRSRNYNVARRAGLANDPFQYEEYDNPDVLKHFRKFLTEPGNRGYSVLKMLRQDMFDQHWNKLPKTSQIAEVAQAISDGINHATGITKAGAPKGTAVALFAPRLLMSRAAWLAVDPVKSAGTLLNWRNATEGDKYFAINQIKEKAWVLGTLAGLLAVNQGILKAVGSKQEINFDDPMHSDWLKFKVAGMNVSYGNAMLTMSRLPLRLWQIRESDGGKLKNVVYPDESSYSVLGEYGRSQLSPFASLATTLWLKGDWQNRPLPSSDRPVPKRQRLQGVEPYSWPEFWSQQVLPIPAEEAVREVWKTGMGMSPEQVAQMRKALATIAVMTMTGARVTEDTNVQ